MPLMQMLRVEALERKIPGVLFPLGCTSSRLGSVWFTFFFFFLEKGHLVGGKMWERNRISGMVWFHGLVCNKLDKWYVFSCFILRVIMAR